MARNGLSTRNTRRILMEPNVALPLLFLPPVSLAAGRRLQLMIVKNGDEDENQEEEEEEKTS